MKRAWLVFWFALSALGCGGNSIPIPTPKPSALAARVAQLDVQHDTGAQTGTDEKKADLEKNVAGSKAPTEGDQASDFVPAATKSDEPVTVVGKVDSKVLSAEEKQALDEFQKLYRLDKDQIVKYIGRPFVAGRLIDRAHRWKNKWQNGDYQPPRPDRAGLIPYCYIYYERDGDLAPPHHFASSSDQGDPADEGVDLVNLMGMIANVRDSDLIDPDDLLKRNVAGDWIIRAGAPIDQVIAAVGQILNRECRVPIKMETHEDLEDVVVVRGRVKPPFVPKIDTPIKLYVNTFQLGKGEKEQGSYQEFLDTIGQFIKPNRRVISEVENPPQVMMTWHRNFPARFDDGDVNAALEHLDEQTALKFTLEVLKTLKITVARMAIPRAPME